MAFDPRPQAQLNVVGGTPHPAYRDGYTDQAFTNYNVTSVSTAVDPTDRARGVNQQMTRSYEVDPTNHKPVNDPTPLPNAKAYWVSGRDPYANHGMVGQPFF